MSKRDSADGPIKPRQKLGKYRVEGRIARGGFADVYKAFDTVEGISVVLKVPHPRLIDDGTLDIFRKEVRLTAALDHPNVLSIKNAAFIGSRFVIVYAMGEGDLADRMKRRISTRTALEFIEQMLAALAYAHEQRIVHCDVKPENMIVFPGNRLRLTDFGIAKVALRTLRAFGTGTVGFVAPEQAMGRPSFRSDVFSAGLVMYRLLAGKLPEWPFEWPHPGLGALKRKVGPEMIELIRRAIDADPRRRFEDCGQMLAAFRRIKGRSLAPRAKSRTRQSNQGTDWQTVRWRQFRREYGRILDARHECAGCGGPVSEAMSYCPWCQRERKRHKGTISFPAACPRCKRGVKLDWRFCAWCYGGLIGPLDERSYSDTRYQASCSNRACRGDLMPFMRYCPWCRAKVTRPWKIEGTTEKCRHCKWACLDQFWSFCPWCSASV